MKFTKVCGQCCEEKKRWKFYRSEREPDGVMPVCKCCHNGLTTTNEERKKAAMHRRPTDPTESEVVAACESIRTRWSKKKTASRKKGRPLA